MKKLRNLRRRLEKLMPRPLPDLKKMNPEEHEAWAKSASTEELHAAVLRCSVWRVQRMTDEELDAIYDFYEKLLAGEVGVDALTEVRNRYRS